MPGACTATTPTASTVARPTQVSNGAPLTALTATGARFRPMAATMAPVTTGGISRSTQRYPTACTTSPISRYNTPAAMMPPSATGIFGLGPLPA